MINENQIKKFYKEINEGPIQAIKNVSTKFTDWKSDPNSLYNKINSVKNIPSIVKNKVENITGDVQFQRNLSKIIFGKGIVGNVMGAANAKLLPKFAEHLTGSYSEYENKKKEEINKNKSTTGTIWDKLDKSKDEGELKKGIRKSLNDLVTSINDPKQDPIVKKELSNLILNQWKEFTKNQVQQPPKNQTQQPSNNTTAITDTNYEGKDNLVINASYEFDYNAYKYIVEKIIK